MIPKVVMHKRNGHRQRPPGQDASLAEVIRLLHSVRDHSPRPSFDLLKFGNVVRSETTAALVDQAAQAFDGLQFALTTLVAQTQRRFDRGEMVDVRETLDALRAQADAAGRMMARLVSAVETRGADRRLLNLNEVVVRMLDVLRARLGTAVTVASHLDPELPWVVGNAGQLEAALVAVVTRVRGAGGASHIVIETSHVPGVVRGERVVRLGVQTDGSALPEELVASLAVGEGGAPAEGGDADVDLAARVVRAHGGVVAAGNLPAGGARVTIELPAL
jgi:signal transduction histidine kinase